jgi:predicted Zn finger-like uncharacterized protein
LRGLPRRDAMPARHKRTCCLRLDDGGAIYGVAVTPEEVPIRCPACGYDLRVQFKQSRRDGDAPVRCPKCGKSWPMGSFYEKRLGVRAGFR